MKLKFHYAVSVIIAASLVFFSCKPALPMQKGGAETVLKESERYFSSFDWTEAENIVVVDLPEPFAVKGLKTENLYEYGDSDLNGGIFPSLEGLGVLDYSGIDGSLISFFNLLTGQIKKREIDIAACVKEKTFLPFMINYKLKLLHGISSVFFSRPEYGEKGVMVSKFRCNITGETKNFTILEIGAVFSENRWLIYSFDIIGDVDAGSIE